MELILNLLTIILFIYTISYRNIIHKENIILTIIDNKLYSHQRNILIPDNLKFRLYRGRAQTGFTPVNITQYKQQGCGDYMIIITWDVDIPSEIYQKYTDSIIIEGCCDSDKELVTYEKSLKNAQNGANEIYTIIKNFNYLVSSGLSHCISLGQLNKNVQFDGTLI